MTQTETGLAASKNFVTKFYDAFKEYKNNNSIEIHFTEYETPIDSSEAYLQLAVKLHDDIVNMSDQTDSFLVLMGSDTLSYISSALAYLMHDKKIPVVMCGSMIPLICQPSDAELNLRVAIENLASESLVGVKVAFGGKLIPAVRCTKLFAHTHEAMVNTQSNDIGTAPMLRRSRLSEQAPEHYKDFDIRTLRVVPSMHTNYVESVLSGKPDAVIIQCYGSGTIPGPNSAFAIAIKKAISKKTPLFAISQCLYGFIDLSAYSASRWLSKLGIVCCGDMNFESTYTKLWYLLNHNYTNDELFRLMQVNLCGEISSSPQDIIKFNG